MKVKVINRSKHELPAYETVASAGLDVRANIDEAIELPPMGRALIKTGLFLEIPVGYECQVRPRSGLALKKGISVLNSPGTIDADYRGEIGVIVINHGLETVEFQPGDRIAQLIIAPVTQAELVETEDLNASDRSSGGFGHTGVGQKS